MGLRRAGMKAYLAAELGAQSGELSLHPGICSFQHEVETTDMQLEDRSIKKWHQLYYWLVMVKKTKQKNPHLYVLYLL